MEKLKAKADKLFSIFIRGRYMTHEGYVRCYTCGKIMTYSESQCGHFRKRGNTSVRFNENNARPQCYECNCEKGGEEEIFEENLRDELGDEIIDNLIKKSNELTDYSEDDYKKIIHSLDLKIKKIGIII